MEPELYEREHMRSRTRRLSQTDIRITFLLAILGIALINLFG